MPSKYIPPQTTQNEPPTEGISHGDALRLLLATGARVGGQTLGTLAGGALGGILGTLVEPIGGTAVGAVGGGMLGGGIGGGLGEALAEKIEPGTHEINPVRVGVNAAIGAIPGAAIVKAGRPLASAGLGAGLSYTSTAANKMSMGEGLEPSLNPLEWSKGEKAGLAIGAITGGALGKFAKPGGPKPPASPTSPEAVQQTIEDTLKKPPSTAPVEVPLKTPKVNPTTRDVAITTTVNPPLPDSPRPAKPNTLDRIRTGDQQVPAIAAAESKARAASVSPSITPVRALDENIGQAADISTAARKVNETARKAENSLLKREQTADLQDLKAKQAVGASVASTLPKLIKKSPAADALKDIDSNIADTARAAKGVRTINAREEAQLTKAEQAAELQNTKAQQQAAGAVATELPKLIKGNPAAEGLEDLDKNIAAVSKDAKIRRGINARQDAVLGKAEQAAELQSTKAQQAAAGSVSTVLPRLLKGNPAREGLKDVDAAIATQQAAGKATRTAATKFETQATKAEQNADLQQVKTDQKSAADKLASDRIADLSEGLEEQPATVVQKFTTPIEGGTETATRRFTPPKPEKPGAGGGGEPVQPKLTAPRSIVQKAQPEIEDAIDKAVKGGYKGDPQALRDDLYSRLEAVVEGREQLGNTGTDPSQLMKAIAKLGGISSKAETAQKGEIAWLKASLKGVPGARGVFSEGNGRSLDDIATGLRQDSRFAHVKGPTEVFDELRKGVNAAQAETPAQELVRGLKNGWWKSKAVEPEVPAAAPAATSGLRVYKSPLEAAGENYGAIKAAKAAGEKVPEEGRAVAGRAAGRIAKEETTKVASQNQEDLDLLASLDPASRKIAIQNIIKDQKGALDPALAVRLGMTVGGGAVGYATDPLGNKPLSAAAGAAGGAMLSPTVLRGLMHEEMSNPGSVGVSELASKAKDVVKTTLHLLPDVQRFNLLASWPNLPINMFVGPWGASIMAGLEKTLAGDERGKEALKLLLNPINFPKEWYKATGEAGELIEHAATTTRGEYSGEGPKAIQHFLSLPGKGMTAGDVAARNILMNAGFSADEARQITLTSEPYSGVGRGIRGFKKGAVWGGGEGEPGKKSVLADLMLPFYRTNVNQVEQGFERTPLVGFLWDNLKGVPTTFREQVVKQGMGAAVGTGAYLLGTQVPASDQTSVRVVRKLINDFGGQYGTIASTAFMAGLAAQQGKNPVRAAGASLFQRDLPMPSSAPVGAAFNKATSLLGGEPVKTPSGLYPLFFDQLPQLGGPDRQATPPRTSTTPTRSRYIPPTRK